jgi:hypothetical protein
MKFAIPTLVFSMALGNAFAYGQTASSASPSLPKPTQALILPFAAISNPSATPGPSGEACPKTADQSDSKVVSDEEKQKLTDIVSTELQKRLAKKMTARVGTPSDQATTGTLVVAGCFIRVDPGNAAKRMAGMNMGTSHLGAHVIAKLKTADGSVVYKEFDAVAKGGRLMPPIGPVGVATHAAAERRETLSADAKRLADDIVKNLSKTQPN